jgi:hypothetical protein
VLRMNRQAARPGKTRAADDGKGVLSLYSAIKHSLLAGKRVC